MSRSVAAVQSVEAFILWRSQLERVGKVLRGAKTAVKRSWLEDHTPLLLEEFAAYAEPFTVFTGEVLDTTIIRRFGVGVLTRAAIRAALEVELRHPLPSARDLAFTAQAFEREAQAHAFEATTRAVQEQVALGDCVDLERAGLEVQA